MKKFRKVALLTSLAIIPMAIPFAFISQKQNDKNESLSIQTNVYERLITDFSKSQSFKDYNLYLSRNESAKISLVWAENPGARSEDYDLEVYDSQNRLVATSNFKNWNVELVGIKSTKGEIFKIRVRAKTSHRSNLALSISSGRYE